MKVAENILFSNLLYNENSKLQVSVGGNCHCERLAMETPLLALECIKEQFRKRESPRGIQTKA